MDAMPQTDAEWAATQAGYRTSMTEVFAVVAEIKSDAADCMDMMSATMFHLEANGLNHWLDISQRVSDLFEKCDGYGGHLDRTSIFDAGVAVSARAAFKAVEAALGVKGLEDYLEDAGFYRCKDEAPDEAPAPIGAAALVRALSN